MATAPTLPELIAKLDPNVIQIWPPNASISNVLIQCFFDDGSREVVPFHHFSNRLFGGDPIARAAYLNTQCYHLPKAPSHTEVTFSYQGPHVITLNISRWTIFKRGLKRFIANFTQI